MSENRITKAVFGAMRSCVTAPLWQYDYGQILQIVGLNLPEWYEVHFSNSEFDGEAKGSIGTADGVTIPDEFLLNGTDVYAWLFLHDTETDGETEYKIRIPVKARAKKTPADPTPVQQDEITQAIAALNQGVERSETASESAEQSASDAAESARQAKISEDNAATSEGNALESERAAKRSENAAEQSEENAGISERNAKDSEQAASQSADRAEQAAKDAGYMFFYIDENGDLIYQRTSNVNVDFYLLEGDLYVKAVS